MNGHVLLGGMLVAGVMLGGCQSSEKVLAQQIGDLQMSCEQIKAENAKLDEAQKKIDKNREANGTNVAAALFWLPGLAYTFYDASDADKTIRDRRAHLTGLYNNQRCT